MGGIDHLSGMLERLDPLLAGVNAHEPLEDPGVAGERAGIRVVGSDEAPHRVFCHQRNLKADCPLDLADLDVRAVHIGHDPGSGLEFDIDVCPLEVVEFGQVVLERPVGGHRGGLIERHAAGIDGDVLLPVDIVHHFL